MCDTHHGFSGPQFRQLQPLTSVVAATTEGAAAHARFANHPMTTIPSSIAPPTKSTTERRIFDLLAAAYPHGICLHRLRRSRHRYKAKGIPNVTNDIDLEHRVARCQCQEEFSNAVLRLRDYLSELPETPPPAKRSQSRRL